MTTEAANTAELLGRAREALERYLEVRVDDDGALTFSHAGVPAVIQSTQLAEGLTVLSLTCVVAWDLPDTPGLAASAAERAGEGLFGTLGVTHTERGLDLTLRYAFPAQGLDIAALGTLLMLVVSTASQLRAELLPAGG
ncbi:hypothetical protein [Amycolatopsis pithecellobii]|uniref:YbjN domain-containing protein n=1 Tax=Amycolatopsis pithecellobii TaxID=664692 RepID=A0A6N7Z374_9PSEU|nr:hypothetical protein [Amycolatopsis pithecellobii]MTD54520.1 hypothetical protein [Amycolatopsis pithecellobii]